MLQITVNRIRSALQRFAKPATTRQIDPQASARRHVDRTLADKHLLVAAGLDHNNTKGAILATAAAAGGVCPSIEGGGIAHEGLVIASADHNALRKTAAITPRPAGVGEELLMPEHQRCLRFGDFDGNCADAGRKRGSGEPVFAGPRTGTPESHAHHVERRIACATSARHRQHPDTAGRLAGHLPRQGLFQTTEHQVGQHLADHMPRGHRTGPQRRDHRTRLGQYLERFE